jgi:hypothetical protein
MQPLESNVNSLALNRESGLVFQESMCITRSIQMNGVIKTELNIPDLWYDFYARLLPGAAFVTALWLIFQKDLPDWKEIVLLAFASYFCGLIAQPIASRITVWIEYLIELLRKQDKDRAT